MAVVGSHSVTGSGGNTWASSLGRTCAGRQWTELKAKASGRTVAIARSLRRD